MKPNPYHHSGDHQLSVLHLIMRGNIHPLSATASAPLRVAGVAGVAGVGDEWG